MFVVYFYKGNEKIYFKELIQDSTQDLVIKNFYHFTKDKFKAHKELTKTGALMLINYYFMNLKNNFHIEEV